MKINNRENVQKVITFQQPEKHADIGSESKSISKRVGCGKVAQRHAFIQNTEWKRAGSRICYR